MMYALPILDNELVPNNTEFRYEDNKAFITFFVANGESKRYLDKLLERNNHTLSVCFDDGAGYVFDDKKMTTVHGLFANCEIKIKRIDSSMDEFTEVELIVSA